MTKQQTLSRNPWLATRTRTGVEYDAPYEANEKAGIDVHGEANLVTKLLQQDYHPDSPHPHAVLDAGCGTGRMGIELARRGFDVVGVDLDEVMLAQARKKAPTMAWHLADLAAISLDKRFDAIVLAGNVMIYLTPGTETAVLTNLTRHLKPNGLLLAAFELNPYPWTDLTLPKYEAMVASLGLSQLARWSTWEQDPWREGDRYVVSLHQRYPAAQTDSNQG
ncbi:MAG: class I SAM-dependent methyltransferase [Chloroflexota bacterium]